ncbi:DUF3866 family protein [Candidatus Contubernalis alkaliaceticus]|uniref:DUF3866 family protein n=1 Tax=Candidatus Contubernalis alkaliaceticus TaxID=338645 RepID=UPI001F4C0E92|nr:DUF3866 family protein [Candidatus Contubernalis alkalaceticus]UNC92531.1 DUF3866 family protein [Candidatus Contubernalis alkalaceticus]
MFRLRPGNVKKIIRNRKGIQEAWVEVEGNEEKTINYTDLTGVLKTGDEVIVNTTALHLNLGTGGKNFVFLNSRYSSFDISDTGHIMKLRYTPYQIKVLSCEEQESPHRNSFKSFSSLNGLPVLMGELHSMLAPAAAVLKYKSPGARIVYIMTDGAALPIEFSDTVSALKAKQIITGSITTGHAFGGDLEAVNVYTALIAASEVFQADVAIVTMGPGNVGTDSEYGFSGMEQGEIINAVTILGGQPVYILRVSFADPRERHKGISHHSLKVLKDIAMTPAAVCLPETDDATFLYITRQLESAGIYNKHRVINRKGGIAAEALKSFGLRVKTMGRALEQDRIFFESAGASAVFTTELMDKRSAILAVETFSRVK